MIYGRYMDGIIITRYNSSRATFNISKIFNMISCNKTRKECAAAPQRSAAEEGLLVGISSGATLAAIAQKLPEIPAGATVLGAILALSPIDPIRLLFWAAVINGVVAVPVMVVMMTLVSSRTVMGEVVAGPLLRIGGWTATLVMAAVVTAMLATWSVTP